MRLTRKKAIDLSIELWGWLAETGEEKEDWPGWKGNGGQHSKCESDCFLCEYCSRVREDHTCGPCPYRVRWSFCEGWGASCEPTTPYTKWRAAVTETGRKQYAQEFLEQLKQLQEGK